MSTMEKTFNDGEIIIREGDTGNTFFQLLGGNFFTVDFLTLGGEEVDATVNVEDGLFKGGNEFVSSLTVGDRVIVGV